MIGIQAFNCCSSSPQDGWSALLIACFGGFSEIVRILLEVKADVNMKAKVSDCDSACVLTKFVYYKNNS